jgi:D-glycero-alpha-D-manno-heptose-7-phosphate kinase
MFIARTPLRISLCGGGTDLSEYYRENSYGAVCSFTIDKYVTVTAKELSDLFPFKYKLSYSRTELLPDLSDSWGIQNPILRHAIENYDLKSLDFNSMADMPAGTGMGSSSSFAVATIHALALMKGLFLTKEELAQAACKLEIEQVGEPIGKQDQYAAAYGGLNYIRFNADESVHVQPVIVDAARERDFLSHLRLYSLGSENRAASKILKSQKKTGRQLDEMKQLAASCVDAFVNGCPKDIGTLLDINWRLKRELSEEISNPKIDALYEEAKEQGAFGGKLLGAGSAGFLLICARPEQIIDLGLKEVKFNIEYAGSKTYYLGG